MSYIEQRERLKKEPTVGEWELEIRRMLFGKRAIELLRVGGAEEYISILVAESTDKALAETTFREALRIVVQESGSQEWRKPESAACLLDLIGAFSPSAGFGKLIEILDNPFRLDSAQTDLYPSPGDLHLKALVVLGAFFPAAPLGDEQTLSFGTYVATLKRYLPRSRFAGYALFRLLELGVITAETASFIKTVEESENAIEDVVEYFVTPTSNQRIRPFLTSIYLQCLRLSTDHHERFKAALGRVDAGIVDGDSGPVVILPSGLRVALEIPWSEEPLVTDYMEKRHSEVVRAGQEILSQLIH